MKQLLTVVILVAFLQSSVAALPAVQGHTLADNKVIPARVLKRSVSAKFYKSLLISPIKGWVVVRANLAGARLSGMRLIHSELDGAYDSLALERAKEVLIAGYRATERPNHTPSVLLHLMIYDIADGTMALSFAHLDEPGGDQMEYWGCARLAVLKNDGTWTDVKGPESLEGKGWAVRSPGWRNEARDAVRSFNN
ncbi:MAG TPA: hypothetical protein VJU77_03185 [Chthoniobacterales bacterium]|nr:hypothetical protein [Chthoniobacterales bacterium]